ncbi:hypothetical protein QFZ34_002111 [Phyllobacterium ifriqiyense]|uniref:Uncharacterized protein n=1 Tax=Phyllobacterium ifriqiyense TaxID=314238 RepID=A0ABU0S850_9HYPH|nr:hypothetical protein [Phyllobacterium ifriqiyense]MDQ0996929.1 hypothetical protein [Phyllobacterium ifriqiyense]
MMVDKQDTVTTPRATFEYLLQRAYPLVRPEQLDGIREQMGTTLAHQPVTAGWEKEREALMKVAWAAKEFIDDWTKGDFSLSTLAALDAQSLDDALTALAALKSEGRK